MRADAGWQAGGCLPRGARASLPGRQVLWPNRASSGKPFAMPTSLIVVDDFFADAEGFREAGLRLTYPAPEAGQESGQPTYFPGRNSLERLEIEGLDQYVSQLTGERLKPLPPPAGHAKFRLTLASDVGR